MSSQLLLALVRVRLDEMRNGLKVTLLEYARVVISTRQRFPDLSWRRRELVQLPHVRRPSEAECQQRYHHMLQKSTDKIRQRAGRAPK